jgi:hypothetical protein
VETIESLMKAFWQDKARGLLLGQACADAIGVPFLGRVVVSNEQFTAHSDGPDTWSFGTGMLRYSAGTALTMAVAGHVATLGSDLKIDVHTLATSQGLLSEQGPVAAQSIDPARPWIGVSGAVPAYRASGSSGSKAATSCVSAPNAWRTRSSSS